MTTPNPINNQPAVTGHGSWMPGIGRRQWLTYLVLCLLALADAYAFWVALDLLLRRDKEFLVVVVIALSLGSVYGAHEIGRMARARWANPHENPALPGILIAAVLLGLGGLMFWIRAHPPGSSAPTNGFVPRPSLTDNGSSSLTIALLFLGLYLLTGLLAAVHAYRFGDPRSAEIQEAIRVRRRLNRELVKKHYDLRLRDDRLKQNVDDQDQESKARDGEYQKINVNGKAIIAFKDEELIKRLGDPAATDAINRRNKAD